jgi:hypothetical protein
MRPPKEERTPIMTTVTKILFLTFAYLCIDLFEHWRKAVTIKGGV